MSITTSFLIYASLFRLAVIVAGTIFIYLGYKLFLRGVGVKNTGHGTEASTKGGGVEPTDTGRGTEASAKGGGFELTLKNAMPGSVFGFFGAIIIAVMLVQGSPELMVEDLTPVIERETIKEAVNRIESKRRITLKGRSYDAVMSDFQDFVRQGNYKQQRKEYEAALEAYQEALSVPDITLYDAAPVFNEIAWIYETHGDIDAALVLSRIAVRLDESNGAFQNTLAEVLLKRKQNDEAVERARKAVKLFPSAQHLETLARALEATGDTAGALAAMKEAVNLDSSLESKLQQLEARIQ